VLKEIGINEHEQAKRVVEVWNKADLLPEDEKDRLVNRVALREAPAVLVSAATGQGLTELLALIRGRLFAGRRARSVVVDHANGSLIHWLYENTEVLQRRDQEDGNLHFEVRVALERERDLDRRLQQAAS
jgi:GTP-binding protein HflX